MMKTIIEMGMTLCNPIVATHYPFCLEAEMNAIISKIATLQRRSFTETKEFVLRRLEESSCVSKLDQVKNLLDRISAGEEI